MTHSTALYLALSSGGTIAPAWLIVPLGLLALMVVAGHVLLIDKAAMPPMRRRIRKANSILMMFTIPIAAAAFSVVSPNPPHTRLFVMTWMLVVGLVVMVLLLAVADIVNTMLMHRAERRELRIHVEAVRAALLAAQARERSTPSA